MSECIYTVYKIVSKNCDGVYIGCTKCSLSKRLRDHVWDYHHWVDTNYNYYYCSSYDIIAHGCYDIVPILKIIGTNKDARFAEKLCVKDYKSVNIRYPCVRHEEERSKRIHNEWVKNYYKINKESIKKRNRTIVQCECGDSMSYAALSRHKKREIHSINMKNKELTHQSS